MKIARLNSINFKGNFELCPSTKANFRPDTKDMLQKITDSISENTPENCEGVIVARNDKKDENYLGFSIYRALPDGTNNGNNTYLELVRSYYFSKEPIEKSEKKDFDMMAKSIGEEIGKELS